MICYILAMGKQHLGPHVVVGYGIKMFWPGCFITLPDHLGCFNKVYFWMNFKLKREQEIAAESMLMNQDVQDVLSITIYLSCYYDIFTFI